MEELKGCPFCGSGWHAKEFGVYILWHEPTCVFGGPNGVVHSTTMDDLFAIKWNTRSSGAAIKELVEALDKACRSINDLIESSEGVAGLHLNGDVASWGSLRAGGRFESWLIEFDEACDVLAKHKPKD